MARDRANAAAQAMFDAESALDVLAVEIADTEADVAALEGEVGLMRDSLARRAVQRFTQGGTVGSPLFTPVEQINAVTSADVYTGIANDSTLTSMDDFQMAIEELEDARADLEEQRAEEVAARESHEALKSQAEAEVVRLQEVEQQLLAAGVRWADGTLECRARLLDPGGSLVARAGDVSIVLTGRDVSCDTCSDACAT